MVDVYGNGPNSIEVVHLRSTMDAIREDVNAIKVELQGVIEHMDWILKNVECSQHNFIEELKQMMGCNTLPRKYLT